ncbi:TonB-dependent receptor [Sphingomonas sp. Leaf10]|uniref:TonB-dependent receptor n=1 Tax=Sphingomonas sp. Leaf10 TaxID=1735676 RepID=UPI0006F1E2DE|nr:TonB-dependent receptor [Sphingomonas sp. Leaf10]KQM41361.1 TonB-dependent receptor [Sphingomonas sp. Leaf10]
MRYSSQARSCARLTRGASITALIAAGALAGAGTAFAQTATTTPEPTTAQPDGTDPTDPTANQDEDIVVTGFRASLENAVAEKKNRDQVVESISAEDIGKLPDASIAESIARLPGLTSQRVSGRSNSISIRGFAPDFSTTLLNGREQTSTGDNRAVEYDQYPAEIMSQVVVYKTGQANLIGQGLSGTVDLRTVRPLEYGRQAISIGARGTYADLGELNAGSRDKGYRVSGTYIDQFADDTIGIALSANYLDEPYQIQEFNAWGYAGFNGQGVIGGSKSYVTSTRLKRLGLSGTLQYKPVDNLTVTVDGFYSDFNDDQLKRGIELPLGYGQAFNDPTQPQGVKLTGTTANSDGFITSGTFGNVEGVVRNDAFERKAKLYAFGYNMAWRGDDGWNATLDASYSRTDREEIILESYAGTGYGQNVGAKDTIGFTSGKTGTRFSPTLNYSDPNLILLTDPLGWGGSNLQAGYYNDREVQDRIAQYRFEVEKELDGFFGAVKAGLNYTDRDKSLSPQESLLRLNGGLRELRVPDQYLKEPTSLSYLGLGPMLSYDPRELLAGGVYRLDINTSDDVPVKAFRVEEDLMTMYVQADINQDIGGSVLTGNIGVQAVTTEQKSSGLVAAGGILTPVTRGTDYWDVMPSLNLSLRMPGDWVVRAGAARQVQRPRLDDMRMAIGYGYNPAERLITGGGGNPYLRPIRSNSFDLTLEKYFGRAGYVAAQGFYKDLKSYVYNQTRPFDYANFPTPTGAPAGTSTVGRIDQPINGDGGSIYGVELAATLPLSTFVSLLDGFGVTGGGSWTKTQIKPDPNSPPENIPGYSKWVINGTAYFEKWGFSARGSARYRSTFVGELSGFGGNRQRRRALDETIIDAQVGYEFPKGTTLEGLSLFVQGQNLADERFATVDPAYDLAVIDYQSYGRRFLAGASFRF